MTRAGWRWMGLVALSVALGVLIALLAHRQDRAVVLRAAEAPPETPAKLAPVVTVPPAVAPAAAEATAPASACLDQAVQMVTGGRAEPQCYARPTSLQSGSVVTYRFEGRGRDARWLSVDVAGRDVVAVSIGRGESADFTCGAGACRGATVGEADLQGMRSVALHQLSLTAAVSRGAPAVLDGRLQIAASDEQATEACAGQAVLVSTSAGRSLRFCPGDGVGVGTNDDGSWTYRYASAEGSAIVVELDAGMNLMRVAYGPMSCKGVECAGIEIAALPGTPARSIRFNGTLVQGVSPDRGWISLAGYLVLPAW